MALWIVRHARPLITAGICYGVLDVQADSAATDQAARELADTLSTGAVLRVSPLTRCQQLAHVLCALRPDLQARTDPRLREMDFGCWEGVAWDAIPQAALQAWTDDFGKHRFGGAESSNEVLMRVARVWDEDHADHDAVWITHAGVARAARLLADGVRVLTRADQWPLEAPGYGQWLQIAAIKQEIPPGGGCSPSSATEKI
jgi:alpha-ribazole phosphatase